MPATTGPRSDLALLRTEMAVLWDLDDRHRLHGPPELVVATTTDAIMAAVGAGIPDHLAAAVLDIAVHATPSPPAHPPAIMRRCHELLADTAPGTLTLSGGPSYLVCPPLGSHPPVPVLRSDSHNAHSVRSLRPDNWEPQEWDELVGGSAGAPWAMVVQDGQVVSICHTPRRTPTGAEAGTWTAPAFRGRGYAAAATAAWADLLAADCPYLFYSTSADNRSSQRVAERLGLRHLGWLWKLVRAQDTVPD